MRTAIRKKGKGREGRKEEARGMRGREKQTEREGRGRDETAKGMRGREEEEGM